MTEYDNLVRAFYLASRADSSSSRVRRFAGRLDWELTTMREELLRGTFRFGGHMAFRIRDPKPRMIHAPAFRQRVAHHALMAVAGPVLDRALVDDSFACRKNKGTLAAVQRAQDHLRRHPWYVKVDIASYFDSIDHEPLKGDLRRRFKSQGLVQTLDRVIGAYETRPGRGLPIGALTSQFFANHYLAPLDRLIQEALGCPMVRYMDDIVWWCQSRKQARQTLAEVRRTVQDGRRLRLREPSVVQRSQQGLRLCGFRVLPGQLRLSVRRKRRYVAGRTRWESAYRCGVIDALALQQGFGSVLATTAHAHASGFRQLQLSRSPWLGDA